MLKSMTFFNNKYFRFLSVLIFTMTTIYDLDYFIFNIVLRVLFIYSESVRKAIILSSFYKKLKLRVYNCLPNVAHQFGGTHFFVFAFQNKG